MHEHDGGQVVHHLELVADGLQPVLKELVGFRARPVVAHRPVVRAAALSVYHLAGMHVEPLARENLVHDLGFAVDEHAARVVRVPSPVEQRGLHLAVEIIQRCEVPETPTQLDPALPNVDTKHVPPCLCVVSPTAPRL